MNARKITLLLVAFVIALGTIFLARSTMKNNASSNAPVASAPVATTEVLVAARDLPAGTLLKEVDMKWQAWPIDDSATGFIMKGKEEMTAYSGAVVRQGLRAGEPLLPGRVVKSREQGFMAAVLNPGMRALSVPVTPVGGVAGFVFPGDRVDVIVTHQINRKTDVESSKGHRVSETVLTNVRVLALDQRADDQAREPKVAQTATLEVTPKQAETLALVTEIGTLSLSLRSLATDPNEPPGINAAAVEAAQDATPAAMPDKDGMTWDSDVSQVLDKPGNRNGAVQRIQIMRGKDVSETVFDLTQ